MVIGLEQSTIYMLTIQIFAIMDPLAAVPALMDALSGFDLHRARTLINKASVTIFLLLTVFSTVGGYILEVLGIDIPYLMIAAGVLLMAISVDTLITGHKPSKIEIGEYVIVPIATPLIVGPGTMTFLITSAKIYGVINTLIASYIAFLFTYFILIASHRIVRTLGTTFIHGLGRFMSIVIAAFAVKMIASGVEQVLPVVLGG